MNYKSINYLLTTLWLLQLVDTCSVCLYPTKHMTRSGIEKLEKVFSSIVKRVYLFSADMKMPVSLRL